MKTEFLKELGLTEEQITAVMSENGKDIQRELGKLAKVELERDDYKERLSTAQGTLKEFEGVNVEELKGKVTELSTQLTDKEAEFNNKLAEIEYNGNVETFFSSYKFTSELAKKAALEEFKKQEFKLTDGKFMGGEDFMKTLKEQNPTAFEEEEDNNKPYIVRGVNPPKGSKKMTLAEAMAYKNAHPDVDITTLI